MTYLTITHFSFANALFTKHYTTLQVFFAQLSLGQSSPKLGGKTYGGDSPPRLKRIDRTTLAGLGNNENGHEWGCGGLSRAHIKPERSYHLQDAF